MSFSVVDENRLFTVECGGTTGRVRRIFETVNHGRTPFKATSLGCPAHLPSLYAVRNVASATGLRKLLPGTTHTQIGPTLKTGVVSTNWVL